MLVNDRPTVEELEYHYTSVTRDERDQLLEEHLVTAAQGGGPVWAWFRDDYTTAGPERLDGLGEQGER